VIEAVTFDYWNTLFSEERGHLRGRRLEAWAGILEGAGFALERGYLDAVFDSSWERFNQAWLDNRQYLVSQAANDVVDALGLVIPEDVRTELVDAFTSAGQGATLHLTPNIGACLRALDAAGVRIGIICDVGMTPSVQLREHLRDRGLLELFDHWSFSDEVGVYKPAAEIFAHALDGLGVRAERAAHVGDLRRTDVAGARAAGMTSVRYTGIFDDDSDTEDADHLVADHADLPGVLGIVG
jgi:putative hydrolase of the HAD superfamily